MPGTRKMVSLWFDLGSTEAIVGHTRYLPPREVTRRVAETAAGLKYAFWVIRIRQYPGQVRANESVSASDQNMHGVEGYRQKIFVRRKCDLFVGILSLPVNWTIFRHYAQFARQGLRSLYYPILRVKLARVTPGEDAWFESSRAA